MAKPTPKEFVKAWQSSSSAKEVAKKLGMHIKTVRSRVTFYRRKGVPLKKMAGGRSIDWGEMKEYARTCLEEERKEITP